MTEKKIRSRKLGLVALLLSLVLIVCTVPASGAFITITDCPLAVNQGNILTICGDAPGLNTLKITLNSLSVQTFKPESFYINVNSDNSYSAYIDTSSLPEGQYQVVVSSGSFEKGKEVTTDLMAKASFLVINPAAKQSLTTGYSTPSLTAIIDKTDVKSGDIVTIDMTISGTSNIEYILIGDSYWEYEYFDTPEDSNAIEIDTSVLPIGEYTVYIIHPKDKSYDVRADNNAIIYKGNYGASFENLYGKQGENRIDLYLQQANDLYKKLKFTVNGKETSGFNQVIVIFAVILGIVVVGSLVCWLVHGVRKQSRIQKTTSTPENNTKTENTARTETVPKKTVINNSTKKYCTHCGAEIMDDYLFCQKCGTKIEEEETKAKYCPNCGAEVGDDYLFCLKCGRKL